MTARPIHYAIASVGGRWYAVACMIPDVREDGVSRDPARVTCPDCIARLASISRVMP